MKFRGSTLYEVSEDSLRYHPLLLRLERLDARRDGTIAGFGIGAVLVCRG